MLKQINHAKRNATFNVAELRRRGYRQIGKGAFSRVLVHPDAPDVVIKVGHRVSTKPHVRDRYEDAFLEFAERIQHHRSKFYPKIYDIRRDGDRFVVVMKRYRKIRNRATARTIDATACSLQGKYRHGNPDIRRFRHALEPFLDLVFDIHHQNVMQDERGTPILTDPVVRYA